MNVIKYSAEGKKFVLTDAGKQIGRVAVKFNKNKPAYHREYKHAVPESWVTKGWVEEVDEGEE